MSQVVLLHKTSPHLRSVGMPPWLKVATLAQLGLKFVFANVVEALGPVVWSFGLEGEGGGNALGWFVFCLDQLVAAFED